MNTREIAAEYRLSHWAQIIKERQASGLSVKQYCKDAGFHENIYFYWQRKLREAACEQLVPTAQAKSQETAMPEGWLVCAVEEPKKESNALTIEIGKCKVITETSVDATLLEKVCRVLSSIC